MNDKIHMNHLTRKAVVYIRQSSMYQVQHNKESQDRQYGLKQHAIDLGWTEDKVMIIDEDLGISGAHSENRPGYQKLISMVALRQVGLILGIEVSRLTRNCLNWYELLELASNFDTLIADEDAVFNPADYNDRLLLGLKGTISEVELHQIKSRMIRGRKNKAQRGELAINLPIGYEWGIDKKVRKSPDISVRDTLSLIFSLFRQIRSVRGVLLELKARQQEIPFLETLPGMGRRVAWHRVRYEAIYSLITNPTFAGAYSYGGRKRQYNPIRKTTSTHTVEQADLEVFIRDHHEGYITYEEYEGNIQTLANNQYNHKMSQGAVREGAALLQGITYCKRCGLKMRPRYSSKYYYCCDRAHRRFGESVCGWASANRVDSAVVDVVLEVLNEGSIDLTFQLMQRHKEEQSIIYQQWEQKIKRLSYEANLARKRYESVDPENRLVAATLESEWNEKLNILENSQVEFRKNYPKNSQSKFSVAEVKILVNDLKKKWHSKEIAIQDKKEILRCLIEQIFIDTQGKFLDVEIIWHGQNTTQLQVPKYLMISSHIYHRVVELAHGYTDSEIANILNQEGILTVKGNTWTPRRLMDFRLSNAIPSSFTKTQKLKIQTGYISSSEAAQTLGVNIGSIQRWFNLGILKGRRGCAKQSKLWIYLDEKTIKRLNGAAQFDTTVRTLRGIMKNMSMTQSEVVRWAEENTYEILRLKRGKSCHFYIQPHSIRQGTLKGSEP